MSLQSKITTQLFGFAVCLATFPHTACGEHQLKIYLLISTIENVTVDEQNIWKNADIEMTKVHK